MKFNFYHASVRATALLVLVAGNVSIAVPLPSSNTPINTPIIQPIDGTKINPDILNKPIIPLNLKPTIYGKIKFLKGKYGQVPEKCEDMKVFLFSEEYTEKPAHKLIFEYEGKVSRDPKEKSDSKTTYCKYSVSADKKFVAKKAYVVFPSIDCNYASDSDTSVIVPDQFIEKDYQKSLCGIG